MKLIVVDIDKLKLPIRVRRYINASKVCTLVAKDFGKKTFYSGKAKTAARKYIKAIFRLKDDDDELKFEDKYLKKLKKSRVGVILARPKAAKILLKLLKR